MNRTWIFQGNPDQFKIDEYLVRCERVVWTVRQPWFARAMTEGDRVFFWRASGKLKVRSGIVASGHIVEPPVEREDDASSLDLWVTSPPVGKLLRAVVDLDARGLSGLAMLDRAELLADNVAGKLTILRMANQTNYPVEVAIAARLESLWCERAIPIGETGTFGSQGFEADPLVRRAVERRAMEVARERYPGFDDVSASRPFDLQGQVGGEEVHVEVKGSQRHVDRVQVTVGEVRAARGCHWRTDLVVVDGITIETTPEGPVGRGGRVRVFERWGPRDEDLDPTTYWCRLPSAGQQAQDAQTGSP